MNYLATLVKNLIDFLPEHSERYRALKYLNPIECLRHVERPAFLQLPLHLAGNALVSRKKLFHLNVPCFCCHIFVTLTETDADIDVLKKQWDNLVRTDWKHYFHGKIPTSSVQFWTAVYEYESQYVRKYEQLAAFALRLLSTPLSNAVVERAFTIMNATKTKVRNPLNPLS